MLDSGHDSSRQHNLCRPASPSFKKADPALNRRTGQAQALIFEDLRVLVEIFPASIHVKQFKTSIIHFFH